MRTYRYRGINSQSQWMVGYVNAPDRICARTILTEKNITVISVHKCWYGFSRYDAETSLFFLYLHYGLIAGYPLSTTFSLLLSSFRGFFGSVILQMNRKIQEGQLLSEVCKEYPMLFSWPVIVLIQVGERGGQFARICQEIYQYLQKGIMQKSLFWKKFTYPLLNAFFCVCTFAIFMIAVFPYIFEILPQDHYNTSTHILYALTCSMTYVYCAATICVGVGIFFLLRHTLYGRYGYIIFHKSYMSFFSALTLLLQEKVSLIAALQITCRAHAQGYLKKIFQNMEQEMQEGKKLTMVITLMPGLPARYVNMIKAGENTGYQHAGLVSMVEMMNHDTQLIFDRIVFWSIPLLMICMALFFTILIHGTIFAVYSSMGAWFYEA